MLTCNSLCESVNSAAALGSLKGIICYFDSDLSLNFFVQYILIYLCILFI